jgi:long-chain acyl-CoA synthetase
VTVPGRSPTYRPITIADGVRTSARRTPEKLAVEHGEARRTYRQLVDRNDRVATAARHGLGLEPGDHAAIMSSNCIEFIEIVLGLASVGVAPAMINTRSSASEAGYVCDDARARVLFVHPDVEDVARAAELATVERTVVVGDDYERWIADAGPGRPDVVLEEWDTFCIPYTAGTTGAPKGVMLPHRSRALTFFSMAVEYGCYGPEDRALGIAPMFHGAGFAFSVAPLFFGGYCALRSKFEPEQVLQDVEEFGITNVFMVPTHFQAIFSLTKRALHDPDTSSLRTIISNAAPLPQVMKEKIVERFGDDLLFEAYGSTEASIVSNLRPPDQLRKQQCVGLPFPCTEVRLLDDGGSEVPVGEVGELFSRSPYLFNGYWQRPDDTTRAMREGWFSAGDLARRDEEGYLYIVDRKNDKIISGGVNIYPREVEEALSRNDAVLEAAVYGVPDDYWGEAVYASVVLHDGRSVTAEELQAFCEQQLARYKLPKGIEFVSRLPRNAAGKILRRELRDAHPRPPVSSR